MPLPVLLAQTLTATFTRSQLRWELINVAVGVLLSAIGLGGIALYFFRRKSRDLTLIYFGLFSFLYGFRLLCERGIFQSLFSASPEFWRWVNWAISAVIIFPFGLFFYRLAGERLRRFFRWILIAQAVLTAAEFFGAVFGIHRARLSVSNNIIVLGTLLSVAAFFAITKRPYDLGKTLTREIRVFLFGFSVWVVFILQANLADLRLVSGFGTDIEFLGFFVFVCCLGYVTASLAFAREERLLALNKELEIARQIQACTLPQSVPRVPGLDVAARYVPMSAVAGDFYDFLVLDDKHIGILVADVTGHGVPAALIASMLKVAFTEQFHHAADPVRVLIGLNRALCGKFEEHFVTAAYVFVDLDEGLMRYAGAGHPPLMLASPSTSTARQIEENGLMLGMFPEASYSAVEIQLQAEDRCLLYTDGAFEATNPALEEFGKLRLEQSLRANVDLPADRLTTAILDEISRWAGHAAGRSRDDDITLLVLAFQESPQAAR
jgi:sigma-B regulation protein RsbU (phosphoserine phosphatase)